MSGRLPAVQARRVAMWVAMWVAVAGALAFVVIAALRVPWDPIPGGPLHPPPASSVFTHEEIQRAEDFSGLQRILSWTSLAVSLVLACVLGFTELGARVVDRVRGPWWWRVVVAVAGLALADVLVTLPLALLLRRRVLEFGLSHQGLSGYAADLGTSFAVNVVATSIGLVVLVGVARRWPRIWPAVAGALVAGLVLLGSFVYPLLVEPLFNHFEALPPGELRTKILELADQEHVHVDDVLVADASRRTTTLNAYVSGFGSSRRVVVYDNLLNDTDQREVLAVVAHELGHARHDDVLTGSLLGAAGALLGVGLLGLLVPDVGEPRRVPRILALVAVATFLALPVQNSISRRIETRADVDSLRTTQDPAAFISLQRDLATTALADPTPYRLSQFWFGSHPTALERIALAKRVTDGSNAATTSARNAQTPPNQVQRGMSGVWDQLHLPTEWSAKMVLQLSWNIPVEPPPKAKTATAMMAAMPAMSRPYSTADAPESERRDVARRPERWPRLRRDQNSWMFTVVP